MKELIMKTTICGAALLLSLTVASCEVYESPEINQGLDEENKTSLYVDAYDPISNVGQYYMPEMTVKPKNIGTAWKLLRSAVVMTWDKPKKYADYNIT